MKIFKAVLFPLIYMGIYYLFQFLFGTFGMFIMDTIREFKGLMTYTEIDKHLKAIDNILVVVIIISGVFSFLIYLGITYLRKQKIFRVCNFRKVKFQYLVIALIFGISLNIINEYFLWRLLNFNIFVQVVVRYMMMTRHVTDANIILAILGVGIIGPIIEEIIFRGLIFNELKNIMPVSVVIIAQGILFGLCHFNLMQSIYAIFMGIMLGVVYAWIKNIWIPIFIHIVNNIFMILLGRYAGVTVIQFSISIIVIILCFLYFYKEREKTMIENTGNEV